MDRLFVGLTVTLFAVTWGFLIYLVIEELQPIYEVKNQYISEEIVLEDKLVDKFVPVVDARTKEKQQEEIKKPTKEPQTDRETTNLFDLPLHEYSNEDGISIDDLLELLKIEHDAGPVS